MNYEIINDLLYKDGSPVAQVPSPNRSREITPRLIVIHYTGDNSCQGAVSWLTARQSGVSAHLVIDKDGTVYQLLPFNVTGWHAKGHYNGLSVNSHSIGIENVGFGDSWPDEQVEAIRAVIEVLFSAYPIDDVIGHVDIPDRTPGKVDPGPNFPWDKVTA